MIYNSKKEINEAIDAGENALVSLNQANNILKSASHWGLYDFLGGGFISGLVKHSKLNKAKTYIECAKDDLKIFKKELDDVSLATDIEVKVGDFLTFTDLFFDDMISDFLVETKICDAITQIDNAIFEVKQILGELKNL